MPLVQAASRRFQYPYARQLPMGIYDRDYYRDDEGRSSSERSMVITLIFINAAVYILQLVAQDERHNSAIEKYFALDPQWFREPWKAYQLLTFGFLHSTTKFAHILFNMFGLWMFGTKLEYFYGRREFLRLYLTLIIFSGAIGTVLRLLFSPHVDAATIGASGGVSGLIVLYALNFPKDTILFFGILPIPAWGLGCFYIIMDLMGALNKQPIPGKANVAYEVHLGGALIGFIYYRTRWTLFSLLSGRWSWSALRNKFRSQPKFRVHDEPDEPVKDRTETADLQKQVDEILAKISRSGESSLTPEERKTLEEASRRYQQRRR